MAQQIKSSSQRVKIMVDYYNRNLQALIDFQRERVPMESDVVNLTEKKHAWELKKDELIAQIDAIQNELDALTRVVAMYKQEYSAKQDASKDYIASKLNAAYQMFFDKSISVKKLAADLESVKAEIKRINHDLNNANNALSLLVHEIKQTAVILNNTLAGIESVVHKNLGSDKFIPGATEGKSITDVESLEIV